MCGTCCRPERRRAPSPCSDSPSAARSSSGRPTSGVSLRLRSPSAPRPARCRSRRRAASRLRGGRRAGALWVSLLRRAAAASLSSTRVISMKRKAYGRDAGLTLRMLFTGFLLGLLYVVFAVVLLQFLNVGLIPMLVIVIGIAVFQYYTSDKLALMAAGAKVVEREQAPDLHAMVERLCAMADLPKPRIAVVDTDVPNAFATGRNPKHAAVAVTTGLWRRLDPKEVESV